MRSFIGQRGHGVTLVRARAGRLADQLDLRHRRRALAVSVRDAVGARVAAADHDRRACPAARDHAASGAGRRASRASARRSGCAGTGSPSRSGRRRARGPAPAGRAARARRSRARPRRNARAARRPRRRRRRRRRSGTRRPRPRAAATRRSTIHFSILKSGTPKRTSPPPASSRSNTVTAWPARRSCCAHASPAGPGADHGDRRPVSLRGGPRRDPALVPGAVDDRELDLLDRHRLALADLEHARRLARRRAEPAGELGEVVRRGEAARSPSCQRSR